MTPQQRGVQRHFSPRMANIGDDNPTREALATMLVWPYFRVALKLQKMLGRISFGMREMGNHRLC